MAPDIEAVTKLLQEEKVSKLPTKKVEVKLNFDMGLKQYHKPIFSFQIWRLVKPYMDNYHSMQDIETRVMSPTTSFISSAPAAKRRRMRKRHSVDANAGNVF